MWEIRHRWASKKGVVCYDKNEPREIQATITVL